MNELNIFTRNGDLKKDEKEVMVKGMLDHHSRSGHPREAETFSAVLKNHEDQTLGAVKVTFLWNGMEINFLWIDDSVRGLGWGRKLMEVVEKEGKKRGCTIAYTNTFPWQAPGFYEKLGYTVYGELENFPMGFNLRYYKKEL